MDTKSKERTAMRRQFTRTANNFESLTTNKNINKNDIIASFKLLKSYYEMLKVLDKEVRTFLFQEPEREDSQNLIDREYEEAGKYEAKWALCQTIFENIIKNHGSEVVENKKSHKLPTLELTKFDGNIKHWLAFWGSFKKIHENVDIDNVDKLQYLTQAMQAGSDVKSFVNSFPLTSSSYDLCITDLKSRYAKEDLLIQVYVRELLSLILNKKEFNQLSDLVDQLNGQLRALEVLGVTKDKYAAFLLPMVESALPSDTLIIWERTRTENASEDPLNSLLLFLKREIESEQRISMAKKTFNNQHEAIKTAGPTATCLMINEKQKQKEKIRSCIWCGKNHTSLECFKLSSITITDRREILKKKKACVLCLKPGHHAKVCRFYIKCYVCGQKHSPVLCTAAAEPKSVKETTLQNLSQDMKTVQQTLLQTVAVKIYNGNRSTIVRALFDSGSQRSYIKSEVAEQLGLTAVRTAEISHSLFGGLSVSFKKYNVYDFKIESLDSEVKLNMSALEQSVICKNVPKVNESHDFVKKLLDKHGIHLTDRDCISKDIELLIGADFSGLLITESFVQLENGLTAIKTKLGWTLQGKTCLVGSNIVMSLFCLQNIKDFWDLEVLGINDPTQVQSKQQKEEEVMTSFEENIQVNTEGRYEVHLPWKTGHEDIQSNEQLAIRRLESITKKLTASGKFDDYNNVLGEWERSGIIEEVPVEEKNKEGVHYLPHRAVMKESSLTTKLRPVYDASAKDSNGMSLNSCLDKGVNFLDKIPNLLTGFRKGYIGITADIAKAFLQISVTPQDRDYLRFVWWKDNTCEEIKVYRHCRVVFGLTASPFLLSATISHHLNQVTEQKDTADILARSFYVDNLVTSLDSIEQTQKFIQDAKRVMNEGKFDLRQWVTSPLEINETQNTVISILGLQWDTDTDELYCNISNLPPFLDISKVTKRNLLSLTQKIFDPIGFTCPVTLVPRLILQKTWNMKMTWDEQLPEDILSQFKDWYDNVTYLNNCRLPRRLSIDLLPECSASLHMFCDASKDGYAACVFLRTEKEGNVSVRLISARSRICPPEKITIPRLELLSALIGSRLLKEARENLNLNCDEFCWSDSGVALCWIKRELPWNTFVGNRVKEIRQNSNANNWHHIPGTENWADLASRGCNARHLLEVRWWEGPSWLLQQPDMWPRSALVVDEKTVNKELKKSVCQIEKQSGKSRQIYSDTDMIMRVKTKLLLTDFPECTKSPMIVPAKNVIIRRMVEQRHLQLLHTGANTMITDLRKRFWILGIRLLVKSVIDKCIVCRRHRSQPTPAPAAPLPLDRVQLTAPFQVTGVDLAGPLYLQDGEKCWIVLYTCAVYRAVHLELTKSLSTEAFLRTFRRFIARRGRSSIMISDNGTNFTGTRNLLRDIDWDEVQRQSTIQRIKWKLNVPTAAWWGGFFERLIKVMKDLLRRVLGTSSVSYDEMQTLLCDCEAVINDRPLTYVEDDKANALEPLRPSCFLQTLPQTDVTDLDQIDSKNLNKRLRYLQKLRSDFRQRFKNEYLTTLVQRGKDKNSTLKVGDIVLIETEDKRIKWPLGLVVEIITGNDGVNRTAKVRTSAGLKTRPFQRLYRLEISSSEVEGDENNYENKIGKRYRIVINPSSTSSTMSGAEVQQPACKKETTDKISRSGRIIKMPRKCQSQNVFTLWTRLNKVIEEAFSNTEKELMPNPKCCSMEWELYVTTKALCEDLKN
ncbi:uncharacterized protein LOC123660165 [Melitaea cinxia]|uniref:uncharacterized protein LOC123660165 n=1 Tax=Melitaea cinxia TaxID=113334 RepID=UPI001E273E93|nr:uncharacterized protein LOC123660165 [Melitaea cinxia]